MHRGFLIDLENVQSAGLDGIEQLNEDDAVLIFYSNKADSLKIDMVKSIHESKAAVQYIKVFNGTPNALDFQLITYLFYYYSEDEKDAQYWIISKDTGYDAAIKMSKRLGAGNVKRAPAIKNAVHYKMKGDKIAAIIAKKKGDSEETEAAFDTDGDTEIPYGTDETPEMPEGAEGVSETPEITDEGTVISEKTDNINDSIDNSDETGGYSESGEVPEETYVEEEKGGATEGAEAGTEKADEPEDTGNIEFQEEDGQETEKTGSQEEFREEALPEADTAEGPASESDEDSENTEKSESAENTGSDAEKNDDGLKAYLENKCGVHADDHMMSVIRQGLSQFDKRGQFYQYFRRHLGGKRGSELYRNVKNHIAEMQEILSED